MATPTSTTVQDVLQIISDEKGETATDTGATRIRALSRAYEWYAKAKRWNIHLKRLVPITSGGTADEEIGSTNFPMRQKGLAEVFVGGTTEDKRYSLVDYMAYQSLINQNPSGRFVYEWYDQANDKWMVHINPTPTSGDTIYYSYFYLPKALTTTTDTIYCEDVDCLVKQTKGYIYIAEDEPALAMEEFRQAQEIIAELQGLENAPAHNQLYSMGAIENSVYGHGIGTY